MNRGPLVVVGDALLDIDVDGTADRLCPEAPVPVVDVVREWHRAGGAGLAAKLAARSASEVVLLTALGDDEAGERLRALLRTEVDVLALPLHGGTPSKKRIRAGGQPIARLDDGDGRVADIRSHAGVADLLQSASGVLVADYGRGVAGNGMIRRLLAEAARRVPLVWDPHPRGAQPVRGSALVTPNDAEAARFAGGKRPPDDLARSLRATWGCSAVAVTLGADGAVLADAEQTRMTVVPDGCRVSAGVRPDTCGAGDRFSSAAAAALYDGADVAEAVEVAVESAARFVAAGAASSLSETPPPLRETRETAAPSAFALAAKVRARGGRLVATGGCFDLLHPGHLTLLEQARAMGDALIVCLNSDESVRRLKGETRPILAAPDRARLLNGLAAVDAVVVFDEETPERLLDRLAPDVWVKGGDYAEPDLPEAEVVRRHGGEVVLVPVLDGYSTTRLVTR
ncbi:D-glycero-beta-D-manno-heptose 1-phosphate adenylyltransferase [Amycolatopsis albispora]|uniref:D-glycero-beta-D-manno-heptose 1-phosphate adenylyltransferase n=1 Tax=Amycolatopsis albispora TaxID=1804986 RepID=A0A344L2X2_9PSEU|nr:D-glycero-beta-D-manno-heptose 1-phosphate adenylyltransferase [Amycolatopsis albispora]AXB42396.1 D-beta-D-heptose 1-phosphate adenosyltransferase [Amycolatopsis albispora]